jgi:RNA polymerase sigma factor (sigma-70 family)
VEASAFPAPAAVARTRDRIGSRPPARPPVAAAAPLLRLRSDEQLVALFRAGHDDAFRVIHDRYRQRLFAYTRQMLIHRQDAEDALQDIFVRAYAGLRASNRELALRAWLYRVAHNRCIDQLRRPAPPPPEVLELLRSPVHDPIAEADRRESLRRLIADVRRLPDQQRSALLMRELGGMSYTDLSEALGVTIPAVKSLLVRARLGLAQSLEARDTACSEIREELIVSHDRGLRPNATARRHMRDCAGCREFRHDLRGVSRKFAAIVPTLGPLGVLANALGIGGGSGAAGGALAAGGAAGGGTAIVSVGTMSAGAAHVATLLAAAVVTAGGAVELQHTLPAPAHHVHHARVATRARSHPLFTPSTPASTASESSETPAVTAPVLSPTAQSQMAADTAGSAQTPSSASSSTRTRTKSTTITTVTVSVMPPATGGTSMTLGRGGAAPSDPADSTTTAAGGALAASTTASTTSTTGTQSSTGSDSTQSGSTSNGSTSGTESGSTSSTGSSSSSGSSTGASTGTSSTDTGSTTGAVTGGTPSPAQ